MFRQVRNLCMLLFLTTLATTAWAQEKVVTGKVTSAEDGTALPGVSVVIKGANSGSITDIDGNYRVTVPNSNSVLAYSYIGFAVQEVEVGSQSVINIVLKPSDEILEEVVVVAYGTADKRSFTGSVGELSAEDLATRPMTNPVNALAGTLAGVQTNAASGQPGSAPAVRIRGFGSVNSSSAPLYVVDGVPYDQDISNLNGDDIESMVTLKDASSAALYGARAANGVVMITTKKGKRGKPKLNIKYTHGVTQRAIPEYDRISAAEYYPVMWEAYRNSLSISGDTPEADANQMATDGIVDLLGYNAYNVADDQLVNTSGVLNPNASLLYTDTDWFEELERNGERRDLNLQYSGANEKASYLVSLGYLNEEGYILNSDFERFSARMNVSSNTTEWLETGMNVSATYTEANNAQTLATNNNSIVNPFNFARGMGPIYPVYVHDPTTGDFVLDENGNRIYDQGLGEENGLVRPGGAIPGRHVIQETILNRDFFKRTVVSGRGYAEATFLKNFSIRLNAGVDLYSLYDSEYDNKIVGDGAPQGRAQRFQSTETTITLNQLLKYGQTFGQHSIEVLAGHESYTYIDNNIRGFRQGQIVDGNDELLNFTTTSELISWTNEYAVEGYLSRLNYNFDERYYFSASYRRDGSSRFARDVRWGNFFSVGASWRLDNESFIQNMDWISSLKLRASWGQLGNDALQDESTIPQQLYYPYQGLYELDFNNASEPGYLHQTLANNSLEWETNTSFDVGTDFTLFNGRLGGTIEYYWRESDNLLFSVPLALSTGVKDASISQNIGTMANSGIEIELNGDIIDNNGFRWNLAVNASTVKNEITRLPQDEIIRGSKKLEVGSSIYDYWLREYKGVNPDDGTAMYRAETYDEARDMVVDGDTLTSVYSNGRFHNAGTAIPDLFGGITNTFSYRGFTLSVLATYQLGGEVLDRNYRGLISGFEGYGGAIHSDIAGRWQQPGDITDIPRVDVSTNTGQDSDRWLLDATHLNLRQITLNYDFPSAILSKAKIAGASAFISAENVALFSERKGTNVIQNFSGIINNAYVPARVFTIGVNIGI